MASEAGSSMPGEKSVKLLRCMDWLQKQNNQEMKKSLQDTNDIQFIMQMHADRRKFQLSSPEEGATVPAGVLETTKEPQIVVSIDKIIFILRKIHCEIQYVKSKMF